MADEVKEVVETQDGEVKEESTNNEVKDIDVEKTKSDAINGFLSNIGVESEDDLKGIVEAYRKAEDEKKDDLTKANDTLTATTKELAKERDARIMAEAKLEAIKQGANAELVDDLVIVAKSKVTSDKNIQAVIAELKESGSIYFKKEKDEDTKNKGVTRVSTKKGKTDDNKEDEKHVGGGIAERIFKNKKSGESHYFKK